jgi:tRNA modification GTPase
MGGIQCQLIDTAGAASPCEAISQAAEQHRLDQAEHCDLRLLCVDASRPLAEWERQQICTPHHPRQLVVLTKCDLPPRATLPCPTLRSSVRQAGGLDELRKAIAEVVVDIRRSTDESSPAAQHCLESVRHARRAIERAAELNVAAAGDELVAGELRVALEALGQVAGAVYTDDLLDRVFSRFCIGK